MALPRTNLDERLLAEGQALRALAASLLGRVGDADDVVQEAYRIALAARATELGYLPKWLRVTLHHLARGWRRGEVRRAAREQVVASRREDAGADPQALAQRAELARDVVAAVHELEEPFRTVVVLRFWHGLMPEAIAAQLGVPRNTVRSRLQRALERLRERLDAKYGARERWSGPLVAFAGVREATATGAAAVGAVSWLMLGVFMQMKVIAAAVLLAAAATFAFWPSGAVEQSPPEAPARTALASAVESADQPQAPQRSPASEPSPSVAATSAPPTEPLDATPVRVAPWTAKVFVFDAQDRPVADAVVTTWALAPAGHRMPDGANAYSGREEHPASVARTDVTGHVTIALDREAYEVEASKEGVGRSEAAPLWFSIAATKTTRMELLPPLFLQGRVVRLDGGPATDAEITTKAKPSTGLAVFRARPVSPVRTDAAGRFVVPVQKWVSYEFVATLDGKQTFREKLFVAGPALPEITLTFPGAITVSGLVVDAEGRPVPAAEVTGWRDTPPGDPEVGPRDAETVTATADPTGRFVLAVRRHARYQVLAAAKDQATSELVAVETTVARPHPAVRLTLPRFATIRGRVLREDGSPFAGIKVLADPEAGLSLGPGSVEKGPRPAQIDLFPKVKAATVADDGSFTLTVHPGTTWSVSVRPVADNWRMGMKQASVAPGRDDVVLTLTDADLAGCVVSGTVDAAFGLNGPFTVSIVDYGRDGKILGSSDASARWEGNRFECRPLPLGQQFGIRVRDGEVRDSRLAEALFGPFRTESARLDVTIRLEPWGTLPVRVFQADGGPARRVKVVSHEVIPTSFGRGATPVDEKGRVELSRLVPGAHRLCVFDDLRKLHEQETTVLPGPNPEIVIRLPAR